MNLDNSSTYQLSVIIVNYNVQYFLNQCLDAVKRASEGLMVEVFIVDNNSIDGSLEMVASNYPEYTVIANNENVGFSKANNQAIQASKGKYVLLLNPDTVVQEDTFRKTIAFMDEHPDAGGLGIHMIDGRGNFLPESKRGLPRPMVAFYKIFGLSSLFPKSKRFSQYHLGHLSPNENHEIDVLSGAFMMMRKETLDKVGLLDENFFMYGEDIDLSYRITQGGYKNYYFSESSIIHYKGESTKKSSVNYVFVFYNAMVIFAKKHFSGKQASLFSLLINLAIYLRAFLALCVRVVKRLFLPLIDFTYIVGGLYLLTNYWKMSDIEFPVELLQYSLPIYALTWLTASFFNGAYDPPVKFFKYFKGVFLGTVLILIAYAILPKSWQFSRLFIFVGAAWVLGYYILSRIFLHFAIGKRFSIKVRAKKNIAIVGNQDEFIRVSELLKQANDAIGNLRHILPNNLTKETNENNDELVFCSNDLSYQEIIQHTIHFAGNQIDFKIAPPNAHHIIGSNSIDTAGDLYILNLNNLVSTENKRKKRLFDFTGALILLLTLPITVLLFNNKSQFVKNVFNVFVGRISFIGFSEDDIKKDVRLPKIKSGILSPGDSIEGADSLINEKLNLLYARDYSMRKDFSILLKCWLKLDK